MSLSRWKQFFTPVKSVDPGEARKIIREKDRDDLILLDVRQPSEYQAGHLPGAKLIPLPQLKDRLRELDPGKTVIAYCARGGRSRTAAQILSGEDFDEVYNLKGGFKGWDGSYAIGDAEKGLELFSGSEAPDEMLVVAYSLEKGLKDFYDSMASRIQVAEVRELFQKLSAVEINHQSRIFKEYCRVTGISTEMDKFDRETVAPAMEGGISSEELLQRYGTDISSPAEVLEMAMAIEAQALDLYSRAAEKAEDPETARVMDRIAGEEKEHLTLLGDLFEKL
jgi:rhodanese-related sulfurtransferase/rubrerythrin